MLLDTLKQPAGPGQHPALWWSTTRTPCGPRTTLWISALPPGSTAARSSPRAPRRRSWPSPASITGQYLSGAKKIPVPSRRRTGNGHSLTIRGAAENNLDHVDVTFPLGTFTCVTGVSGSGKSSLVNEILFKRLGADLNRMKVRPGKHTAHGGGGISGQGHRHRPVSHRPHAPVQPGHLHRAVRRHPGAVSPPPPTPRPGAMGPAASPSMSEAAGARPAPGTAC